MQKIINKNNGIDILNNIVYIPNNDNVDTSDLTLLVFLHGAGERGENLEHLSQHALPKLIENGMEYSALVLCPQCPANVVWDNIVDRIKNTIDAIQKRKVRRNLKR